MPESYASLVYSNRVPDCLKDNGISSPIRVYPDRIGEVQNEPDRTSFSVTNHRKLGYCVVVNIHFQAGQQIAKLPELEIFSNHDLHTVQSGSNQRYL
ncbi:hypothetical protein L3081_25320 [Colwellia sp. MSW7]|uniref:Uncharacterized protein n=1 Tax=Colwellia maritima TaxID=2912588 RepID=A0ABS9X7E9_9GAMM|nr:hypothetical protein [Colwellia maritima]MCI2286141.1 hypothetical protein [Colwellia maritima]